MNYIIDEILKNRKITDYLASKGISPVGTEKFGKIKYRCPLHAGDNTPSFIVYTNDITQNYYCYGCKSKYNIIHLYRELEKISTKEAIQSLSDGLNINLKSEIDYIIKEIENDKSIYHTFTPVDLALIIGRNLYDFLKVVDKNPQDCERVEKLLMSVDDAIDRCDIKTLKKTSDYLQDVLLHRSMQYQLEKEQKLLSRTD